MQQTWGQIVYVPLQVTVSLCSMQVWIGTALPYARSNQLQERGQHVQVFKSANFLFSDRPPRKGTTFSEISAEISVVAGRLVNLEHLILLLKKGAIP